MRVSGENIETIPLSMLLRGACVREAWAATVRVSARVSGADMARAEVPFSLMRDSPAADGWAHTARASARVSGEDIGTAVALAPALPKTANAMVALAPKDFAFIS